MPGLAPVLESYLLPAICSTSHGCRLNSNFASILGYFEVEGSSTEFDYSPAFALYTLAGWLLRVRFILCCLHFWIVDGQDSRRGAAASVFTLICICSVVGYPLEGRHLHRC